MGRTWTMQLSKSQRPWIGTGKSLDGEGIMLPGLVEWRQPISAAASSLVGVHRDDRRFEQNKCFCCRGNRIPVSVGDLFDVEVLNRSRAFRMYWKFSCHEAAQAGPALISDGPLPHSDKHTSQYCWKVCARRPGGALSTHLLSVSPFGRIQGKTT